MYPEREIQFLSEQSCSNLYKLLRDLDDHDFSVALGAGASASVGLPTWSHLLKRICHCYFSQWSIKMSDNKADAFHPPKDVSIALTNSYDVYLLEKQHPELKIQDEILYNAEYWINGKKLSDEENSKRNEKMRASHKLQEKLQDGFMEKIMSGDLTVIAQMIKNKVRKNDWNYLIRKSVYSSYEDAPYILKISTLYKELVSLIQECEIDTIINYNYDDTFYYALKDSGLQFKNCYGEFQQDGTKRVYYPHGYIPMKGGVITDIVLCENEYQAQIYRQDLWANNVQTATLASCSCIFFGLSLNDSNIRRILNMCGSSRRYVHYAFLPISGTNQASAMYDSLCDEDLYRLGIRVIRYPSSNNHEKLEYLIKYINGKLRDKHNK